MRFFATKISVIFKINMAKKESNKAVEGVTCTKVTSSPKCLEAVWGEQEENVDHRRASLSNTPLRSHLKTSTKVRPRR